MARPPTAEELAGIEALRQRDVEASLRLDVEALLANWTEDGVVLPPGGPEVRGKAAMRAAMAGMAAAGTEVLTYAEHFEETLVMGDVALEWGYIRGSERPRAGGEVVHSRMRVMRVLQRAADGTWRFHRSMFQVVPLEAEGR